MEVRVRVVGDLEGLVLEDGTRDSWVGVTGYLICHLVTMDANM